MYMYLAIVFLFVFGDMRAMELLEAASNGVLDSVKICLLWRHYDVNMTDKLGQTPLHIAVLSGYADVAAYLLENSADYNAKDKFGRTPLHWAAKNDMRAIVKKMLTLPNIDLNARDTDYKCTALQIAEKSGHAEVAAMIRKCSRLTAHS